MKLEQRKQASHYLLDCQTGEIKVGLWRDLLPHCEALINAAGLRPQYLQAVGLEMQRMTDGKLPLSEMAWEPEEWLDYLPKVPVAAAMDVIGPSAAGLAKINHRGVVLTDYPEQLLKEAQAISPAVLAAAKKAVRSKEGAFRLQKAQECVPAWSAFESAPNHPYEFGVPGFFLRTYDPQVRMALDARHKQFQREGVPVLTPDPQKDTVKLAFTLNKDSFYVVDFDSRTMEEMTPETAVVTYAREYSNQSLGMQNMSLPAHVLARVQATAPDQSLADVPLQAVADFFQPLKDSPVLGWKHPGVIFTPDLKEATLVTQIPPEAIRHDEPSAWADEVRGVTRSGGRSNGENLIKLLLSAQGRQTPGSPIRSEQELKASRTSIASQLLYSMMSTSHGNAQRKAEFVTSLARFSHLDPKELLDATRKQVREIAQKTQRKIKEIKPQELARTLS